MKGNIFMELLQLKYFCDAAMTENLSHTAKKFYVPTSNISNAIKRLEIELGYELFDHFSNKIALNERGKIFYDNVSKALFLIDDAVKEVKDGSEELSGTLCIRCKSNRALVTRAIEKFTAMYPGVSLKVVFGEAEMREVDLIISYAHPFEYKERILLLEEDVPIAMLASHPLAGKENIKVTDLKNEKFIVGLAVETDKICKNAGFAPNIAFEMNDPAYVRKYIEMGLAIGFIPSVSWKGLFTDKVVLKSVGYTRCTYAYLPTDKYTKRATEEFLKIIANETHST